MGMSVVMLIKQSFKLIYETKEVFKISLNDFKRKIIEITKNKKKKKQWIN